MMTVSTEAWLKNSGILREVPLFRDLVSLSTLCTIYIDFHNIVRLFDVYLKGHLVRVSVKET